MKTIVWRFDWDYIRLHLGRARVFKNLLIGSLIDGYVYVMLESENWYNFQSVVKGTVCDTLNDVLTFDVDIMIIS